MTAPRNLADDIAALAQRTAAPAGDDEVGRNEVHAELSRIVGTSRWPNKPVSESAVASAILARFTITKKGTA